MSFWIAIIHAAAFLSFAIHHWILKKSIELNASMPFLPEASKKTNTVIMTVALCTGMILSCAVILGL